ncbi:MarR family winged helix-turn-helix transcriptional regulator [Marinibaculum pumilum]|uniref:MarR family winged helix-turn-helix transcriptional regulator n=1 Tax=Marinibaculum pumilum TaxID=1766165 RepID=A0ABV7L3K4_9PROT
MSRAKPQSTQARAPATAATATAGTEPAADPQGGASIEGLFSYHLQILANVSTRIALLSIRPEFGLNIMQWRALANLHRLGESTLQALARSAGVLTSQMSRTISQLVARGLVEKTANPDDARSRSLVLTPEGRALVAEVLALRRATNERMLGELSAAERRELVALIRRVERTSRQVYAEMRSEAGGEIVFDT